MPQVVTENPSTNYNHFFVLKCFSQLLQFSRISAVILKVSRELAGFFHFMRKFG